MGHLALLEAKLSIFATVCLPVQNHLGPWLKLHLVPTLDLQTDLCD